MLARSAHESFARLFKGGRVQGQRPWPRSAAGGTLFLLHKAQEGVQGGTLAGGSPSFLYSSTCAPIRWVGVDGLSCDSTPFLWCLPKETVSSRQRKALFYPGGSTIRVSATASVVFTHLRPTWGGAWWLTGRSSQLYAVGGDVGASSSWERRAGPNISRGGTQKRVSLGLHPVSLRKSKEMGWNWQQGGETSTQGNGAHAAAQMRCRLVIVLSTCAPIRWEVVVSLPCDSTPFLWCLPKETVSSRQRKALFCPGGSTIRVSAAASVDGTFLARLGEGAGGCRGVDCRTSARVNFHARFARGRKKSPVRQDGAFIH